MQENLEHPTDHPHVGRRWLTPTPFSFTEDHLQWQLAQLNTAVDREGECRRRSALRVSEMARPMRAQSFQ